MGFNNEIDKEIKIRRRINKERRKCTDKIEKYRLNELYIKQKIKVQQMIRSEVEKHEDKVTREI